MPVSYEKAKTFIVGYLCDWFGQPPTQFPDSRSLEELGYTDGALAQLADVLTRKHWRNAVFLQDETTACNTVGELIALAMRKGQPAAAAPPKKAKVTAQASTALARRAGKKRQTRALNQKSRAARKRKPVARKAKAPPKRKPGRPKRTARGRR
jgi:hypothetical protein